MVLTGYNFLSRILSRVFSLVKYRIAGNFRGVQFSRKASLQNFRGLIFADARVHAYYTLYNRAYFADLIFADSSSSAKTAKIGSHENFPLYGRSCVYITHM